MAYEQTGVIICGGGPTGAILSALLGHAQVPNVVLEREEGITTDPRGIALDEDGIRILQSIGVYDKIFSEIGSCMPRFHFISGSDANLSKRPLLSLNYSTAEGATGHVGFLCHKQPAMEKAIRDMGALSPHSQLRSSCTVQSIREDDICVTAQYSDATGRLRSIQAPFLVGADGKTGYVRKKYLEPKGITMDRCEGTNYEETWVALNWKISLPTQKTHPDFPLWNLGFTPNQVYHLFFPTEFRFLCNPERPSVCGRFGLPSDRLWRFEFVIHKDEDGLQMATPAESQKIIFPYLTHPGSRYGLPNPVVFPADCIEVLRSRPFSFLARSCNKWALGRVIIAGDAAHVFPPFGGQGIASGFRDALALAWRLRLLHQEPTARHEPVLTAWYLERKQQLERSLAVTIQNGEYVTEQDPIKVFIRDWSLWLLQLVPSWRRQIEKGPSNNGMTKYKHADGLPFLPSGGLLVPQVYAWDFRFACVTFSDDLVFSPRKKGLFQLLVLPDSAEEATLLVQELRQLVPTKQHWMLIPEEATILIQDSDVNSSQVKPEADMSVARLATADEFAGSSLCVNRPEPRYYELRRLQKEFPGVKYLVVRPDRFVYAACRNAKDLAGVYDGLPSILLR